MQTLTQTAVPVNALRLAKSGDGRALLSIPDARLDLPRLIAGRPLDRYTTRFGRTEASVSAAALGNRRAIAAAKALVAAREARRADRKIAEAARKGPAPGTWAAKAAEGLRSRTAAAVSDLLNRHYRCATAGWAGGETTNRICLADNPKATSDTTKEWSRNGKWSGLSLARHVHVAPHWLRDVQARGLASIDGLVTTHATPIEARDGIEVFAASWIRQGRGMDIRAESGAIARHVETGTTYHSTATRVEHVPHLDHRGNPTVPRLESLPDASAAIRGLKRKLTAQGTPPEVRDARKAAAARARAERAAKQIGKLIDLVGRWDLSEIGHVEVTRRDSLRAGNCTPGTDDFIDRFFPDRAPESSATIAELAARAALTDPATITGDRLTLARQGAAACLVAIRRDRRAARLLTV